ncbi:MAG: hypothetical protein OXI87_01575 [Albidovulum sp.]|nr:hypothetical protein [Albidovulum sp.]
MKRERLPAGRWCLKYNVRPAECPLDRIRLVTIEALDALFDQRRTESFPQSSDKITRSILGRYRRQGTTVDDISTRVSIPQRVEPAQSIEQIIHEPHPPKPNQNPSSRTPRHSFYCPVRELGRIGFS